MKNLLFILLVAAAAGVVNGQQTDLLRKTKYAIEISQFITGSGFALSTELYFTIIPDHRKNLSFGLFYSPDQKKISGVTMHHELALTNRPSGQAVVPFVFYNMVYRSTRTSVNVPDQTPESTYGLYKSLEHHLGIGVNINLAKSLYVKGALGYGVYFGSIKKPVVDQLTKEVSGSNGFGAIAKFGIAYVF